VKSRRHWCACPEVAAIQPVLLPGLELHSAGEAALLPPIEGGARRQDSVARGLAAGLAARPELEWVLVHDAARCLVLPSDASAVLHAAQTTGAALPVVPVSDTVKFLTERGDSVERTPARARLAFAQTPQAFRVQVLREALDKAERDGFEGTDCASLVERLGVEVRICAGRAENFKVTHPDDLVRAEAVLARRGDA
jgi:2-C-methyl-D-erythritol 4-phosphate cytidylyltransferase/2-C-methyl-D-erythritol 2,4-cyclodiphosphate synthase